MSRSTVARRSGETDPRWNSARTQVSGHDERRDGGTGCLSRGISASGGGGVTAPATQYASKIDGARPPAAGVAGAGASRRVGVGSGATAAGGAASSRGAAAGGAAAVGSVLGTRHSSWALFTQPVTPLVALVTYANPRSSLERATLSYKGSRPTIFEEEEESLYTLSPSTPA